MLIFLFLVLLVAIGLVVWYSNNQPTDDFRVKETLRTKNLIVTDASALDTLTMDTALATDLTANTISTGDLDVSGTATINAMSLTTLNAATNIIGGVIHFATELSHFPAPVGGIITIPEGHSYIIGDSIDFLGNQIELHDRSMLSGAFEGGQSITSTGLAVGTPFIHTLGRCGVFELRIENVDTALMMDGTGAGKIFLHDLTFINVPNMGVIADTPRVVLKDLTCLETNNLIFDGSISFIDVGDCIFRPTDGESAIIFNSTLTNGSDVTFRANRFNLTAPSSVGIQVDALPAGQESFIIQLTTFNLSPTSEPILGTTPDDLRVFFTNNVDLPSSRVVGTQYVANNATLTDVITQNTPVLLNTTGLTAGSILARLTFEPGFHGFRSIPNRSRLMQYTASFTVNGQGNNQQIVAWMGKAVGGAAVNLVADRLPGATAQATTDGTRPVTMTISGITFLGLNDLLYPSIANASGIGDILVVSYNLSVFQVPS